MIKNRKTLYYSISLSLIIGLSAAILCIKTNFSFWAVLASFLNLTFGTFLIAKVINELEAEESKEKFWSQVINALFGEKTQIELPDQLEYSQIFVPKIVEGSVSSRAQLGQALADLLKRAFSLLPVEGVEVALFETSTNYFFFSILMGHVPYNQQQDIFELPLSFSGKILGSVKFSPIQGEEITPDLQELAKLITLQIGVMFVNAEYSSELLKMQQSADETLRAKTGFLANLSHEVRAPLGVIVNATELVLDGVCGDINEDQRHMLSLAKNGTEHLLELLNDVLDYAKIEAGKLTPVKKDISVDEILKDTTTIIRFQAEQKHISVNFRDSVEALAVSVDRKHFRQIIINLLTNAVKYTPDGGKVDVWAERTAGQMIRIYVKDSGVGIDPNQRDKVFAPFERLNHSYSRQQAGVGLGLSLSQRLAEINGGSLDFESKLGMGSKFWLTLKATEINMLESTEEKGILTNLQSEGETLVVIDPDPDHLTILSQYLLNLGYNLKSFSNYEQAFDFLQQGLAQLLIMDNNEFDDPANAVGVEISQLVEQKKLSVLLLSSRAFIFDLEKYLKLGVERCLPKPVPLRELALLCRQILTAKKSASMDLKRRDNSIKSDQEDSDDPSEDLLH